MAVSVQIIIFWALTPCSPLRGTCFLYLQYQTLKTRTARGKNKSMSSDKVHGSDLCVFSVRPAVEKMKPDTTV